MPFQINYITFKLLRDHQPVRNLVWKTRLPDFEDLRDLGHLGAVGERLAVAGNAGLVGLDHDRISEDRSNKIAVLTDGYNLPSFVSSELRERESARHFHGVLVLDLSGNGQPAEDSQQYRHSRNRQH